MNVPITFKALITLLCCFMLNTIADDLPDPDGKPADMSKPVQVYILMGQSNMLGFGKSANLKGVANEKYPYLIDADGNWTERKDVRNVRVMSSGTGPMKGFNNEWMTLNGNIGPEIGIGHYLGNATDAPVLILKSCIGNRSLGWDLLPPGSKRYEYNGKIQAGYGEADGGIPKEKAPGKWYAGIQYDGDTANAKAVLKDLDNYYPGAKSYEVAGFFFWQGDRDFRSDAHAEKYEENLVNLIKALRKDFNAPNANFVCATLGQTKKGSGGNTGLILNGTLAVDGTSGKYPDHKGNVASVYSHPFSMGGSSSGHYSGNPETYMNIGQAMGKAMTGLLKIKKVAPKETKGGSGSTPAIVKISEEQKEKLTGVIQETLIEMSNNGELKKMTLTLSMTKAKVWLAKAKSGVFTFQLIKGTKQASFKFDALKDSDYAVLSRLIVALKPVNKEAHAMAALYIAFLGNKYLSRKYLKKTTQDAIQKVVSSLE